MRIGGALFVSGMLMRLSPDSARTKNTMANIIPSQKIPRTDLFIVLFFLLRASVLVFRLHRDQTAADASAIQCQRCCAAVSKKGKQNLCPKSIDADEGSQEKVTQLLPSFDTPMDTPCLLLSDSKERRGYFFWRLISSSNSIW